jgi:hypothetical protein
MEFIRSVKLNVIQLGFDPQDNKLWWVDCFKWDTRDETPDTVTRPTEQLAFRGLFRQARLLSKRGVFINLSPLHMEALRLEYQAMSKPPYPDNVNGWIAQRMHGVSQFQVRALLDECSLVVLLRDVLRMQPLEVQWAVEKVAGKKAA